MTEIIYIEDVADDREKYAERLRKAHLRVTPIAPPGSLDTRELRGTKPDLFLVDYELTKARKKEERVNYQGGALGAAIREAFPEHPIVLLTRRNLVSQPGYRQVNEIKRAFDELLYKDQIEANPPASAQILVSLADGFSSLRRKRKRNWTALAGCLGARPDETDVLLSTGPPLMSRQTKESAQWRVQEAAHWIRKVVLDYPGVLYDSLYAATALGIAVESFEKSRVRRLFSKAQYGGVFSLPERRWWRSRLYRVAQDIIREAGLSGPTHAVFPAAFRKQHHSSLKPAVCVFSGEKSPDCVCYILQRPVKREFSLPYHPDDRPAKMDEARVSFKAIRESNRVKDELFDEQSKKLLDQIRKTQ